MRKSRTESDGKITVTSYKRRSVSLEDTIVVENTHEAIISKEVFEAIQQMMQRRTREVTASQKRLFTNIIYCKECQRGMSFRTNQRGYRCGGNTKHGDTFCANRKPVREKELSGIILEDLRYPFTR